MNSAKQKQIWRANRLFITRLLLAVTLEPLLPSPPPLIQGLRLQQTQINARISTLASTALEQNPELVAARAQAARIDAQIAAESQKLLQNLRYEADAAQQRVNALKERTNALQANVTEEEHADIRLRQLVGKQLRHKPCIVTTSHALVRSPQKPPFSRQRRA